MMEILHGFEIPRVPTTSQFLGKIQFYIWQNTHDLFNKNLEKVITDEISWKKFLCESSLNQILSAVFLIEILRKLQRMKKLYVFLKI